MLSAILYNKTMRSVICPAIDDVTMEAVFYALGNKDRLQIIKNLYQSSKKGDVALTCGNAVKGLDNLSPSTASHHFRILREGGLVKSSREGKECYNSLRLAELEQKFPGMVQNIIANI